MCLASAPRPITADEMRAVGVIALGAFAVAAGIACAVATAGICAGGIVVGFGAGGGLAFAGAGATAGSAVVISGSAIGGAAATGGAATLGAGMSLLYNESGGPSNNGEASNPDRGDLRRLGDQQYERATGESAHVLKELFVGKRGGHFDIARGSDRMLYLVSKDGRVNNSNLRNLGRVTVSRERSAEAIAAPSLASYAYFMVTSDTLKLPELSDLLGSAPDDGWSVGEHHHRKRAIKEHVRTFTKWTRYSGAAADSPIRVHLDALYPLVRAVSVPLASRTDVDCSLQIVQYFSREPEHGFWLDSRWTLLLASIRASIDVDQYS